MDGFVLLCVAVIFNRVSLVEVLVVGSELDGLIGLLILGGVQWLRPGELVI